MAPMSMNAVPNAIMNQPNGAGGGACRGRSNAPDRSATPIAM